jgi:hypothetical protein
VVTAAIAFAATLTLWRRGGGGFDTAGAVAGLALGWPEDA